VPTLLVSRPVECLSRRFVSSHLRCDQLVSRKYGSHGCAGRYTLFLTHTMQSPSLRGHQVDVSATSPAGAAQWRRAHRGYPLSRRIPLALLAETQVEHVPYGRHPQSGPDLASSSPSTITPTINFRCRRSAVPGTGHLNLAECHTGQLARIPALLEREPIGRPSRSSSARAVFDTHEPVIRSPWAVALGPGSLESPPIHSLGERGRSLFPISRGADTFSYFSCSSHVRAAPC